MKKEEIESIVEALTAKAQELANTDYHYNAGMNRQAWNKDGKIYITCRTLNGRVVKTYKMGRVDMLTGKYSSAKFDDGNLAE